MKHLKMLGLAAVTAAALIAVVGGGSASATVICKNNTNTEKCSEPYPKGTEGTASLKPGTSAVLQTTAKETLIQCNRSIVKGTLIDAGSATTTVKSGLTSLTWEECSQTVVTLAPGSGELHWISGSDNGTLITMGTSVTMNVFGVSCTYGTGEGTDMGTTKGGNPGSLTINAVINKIAGGFLCPSTSLFAAEYVATSPTNAWVSAG